MDCRDRERRAFDRFEWVLKILAVLFAGACALLVLLGTLQMVWRGWTAVPFADQWFDLLSRQPITWQWLFRQHNEHRILFPRLIFIVDRFLASETYRIDLSINIAIQMIMVILIIYGSRKGRRIDGVAAAFCTFLALETLFSAIQYENFLWGYQVQFFGVFLAGAAALGSIALVEAAPLAIAAFAACATLATFTLANGLLCAYVAVPTAILARRTRSSTAMVALIALALTVIYCTGYVSPSWHTDPLSSIRAPVIVFTYSAAEIGSVFPPLFGGWSEQGAAIGGAAGYALCILWFMRLIASTPSKGEIFLFSVALFIIATTLVTAMGRLGIQSSYTFTSRYATPVLLFWTVLLLDVLMLCLRQPSYAAAPAVLACLAWMSAIARVQIPYEHLAVAEKRGLAAVAPTLLAQVDDRAMLHRSDPFDTGFPVQWTRYLRSAGTSVFASRWTRLATADIVDPNAAACPKSDLNVLQVGSAEHPGWRLTGRLADRGGSPHIVLVDAVGAVAGYGLGGFDAASVDRGSQRLWGRGDWWIAESRVEPSRIDGYVLSDRAHPICRLSF